MNGCEKHGIQNSWLNIYSYFTGWGWFHRSGIFRSEFHNVDFLLEICACPARRHIRLYSGCYWRIVLTHTSTMMSRSIARQWLVTSRERQTCKSTIVSLDGSWSCPGSASGSRINHSFHCPDGRQTTFKEAFFWWIERCTSACVRVLNDHRNDIVSAMGEEWRKYHAEHGKLPSLDKSVLGPWLAISNLVVCRFFHVGAVGMSKTPLVAENSSSCSRSRRRQDHSPHRSTHELAKLPSLRGVTCQDRLTCFNVKMICCWMHSKCSAVCLHTIYISCVILFN